MPHASVHRSRLRRSTARRRFAGALAALGALAGSVAIAGGRADAAARITIAGVDAAGVRGHMGLDNLNDNLGTYVSFTDWQADGSVDGGGPAAGGIPNAHIEMYPDSEPARTDSYNAWTQTVGGAHIWLRPVPASVNLGRIPMPRVGDGRGAFRATGSMVSSTALPDNRFRILWFQLDNWQQTSGGQEVGAFGLSDSHGGQWTAGIVWAGNYVLVVTDNNNGSQVSGIMNMQPGQTPVLDVDAFCYGMAQCQYDKGAPPASAGGGFHSMAPVRVIDTRSALGITNGPVRAGDGRVNDIDPTYRLDYLQNHELKVTGANGVPENGVAAVLLNVTVTEPTANGWVAVSPRLARRDVFDDQSWFRLGDPTSNLNFNAGDTLPNLVLARVGAGGYIRFENRAGVTHIVADMVGWYDSTQSAQSADGFVGVVPARLLDTRDGTGSIGGRFSVNETRDLTVVGKFGVPTDATAVVVNVTEVDAVGDGFITVWPAGTSRPTASSLNQGPGRTRPNLVVSKVGASGKISFYVAGSPVDLAVDVVGYYRKGGGVTYAVTPQRILDTRVGIGLKGAFGIQETRQLQVAGLDPVPSDATAVVMNVTGTDSPFGTYITAFPYGVPLPVASNVNVAPGDTAPNLVMVKIGVGGKVSLYAHTGANIVADVIGYVR